MTEVKVIEMERLWVKASTIMKLYDLGKTHTYELINEMRASPKWRTSIVAYGNVVRVNLEDFEKFWRKKSVIKSVG